MRNLNIPDEVYMHPGNMSCPGCGGGIAMNLVLKALDEQTILVIPACCWAIIAGPHPQNSLKVPVLHTAFETAAVTAAGVRAGLDVKGDSETTVVAWAGDGGTFDIGLQSLSGTAERGDDIIFICYDNEAYMNTGIQRSSATPAGGWTTTTPASALKPQKKKNIMNIMAAHGVPYAATASISDPQDLAAKLQKAMTIKGTRFIHLYASCPTGWRHAPELSIDVARMAVQSRVFPLYEIIDGETWHISPMPEKTPIAAYLKAQGRFKALNPERTAAFQCSVDNEWENLLKKSQAA